MIKISHRARCHSVIKDPGRVDGTRGQSRSLRRPLLQVARKDSSYETSVRPFRETNTC